MSNGRSNSEQYRDLLTTGKTLIVGAFSFVAALAWRDLIKRLFELGFGKRNSVKAYILYTFIVTLIAVLVIYLAYRSQNNTSTVIDD